jgi:hypothetical protein
MQSVMLFSAAADLSHGSSQAAKLREKAVMTINGNRQETKHPACTHRSKPLRLLGLNTKKILICILKTYLKGTVARDFLPLIFFINQPHLGLWFIP